MIVYGITAEQASPSSRRAWIEIRRYNPSCVPRPVALLAEGVDRNFADPAIRAAYLVALLAEGVDRNSKRNCTSPERTQVALLAEGVDRNMLRQTVHGILYSRPPRGGRG